MIEKKRLACENERAPRMTVESINGLAGLYGLTPILLVFGALPRIGQPTEKHADPTIQQTIAIQNAAASVSKYFTKIKVRETLCARNRPGVTNFSKIPISALVLMYRPEKKEWDRPYSFLDFNGKNMMVLTPKEA